jgi:hypothetical protein
VVNGGCLKGSSGNDVTGQVSHLDGAAPGAINMRSHRRDRDLYGLATE